MSTTNSTGLESSGTTAGRDRGGIDTDHLELPIDAQLLGVDGAGETHLHSPRADRVYVIDDSETPAEVTHEADIGTRSVFDWVEHVESERGEWEDLRYTRGGWADGVVATVIRSQQAEEADR
ncbi:hypothetical protein [Halobellus rufus]|uniref:hypothetical protein n=1 Tax=Halobellus rufus TaxID=1448860 RepID=UPI000679445A|nr:hypothetical protein [Halobellus rufus]